MKKTILIISIVFCCTTNSNACEFCGCGLGNYYIGLLPQFNHKFIGLRYQYSSFKSQVANDPGQYSRDYYKTMEIWAGWNMGKKWQLLAILPYNFIHQVSDDGVVNNNGIGDIAVMANYNLLDHTKGRTTQQWWIGAGIKAPTGKFNIDAADPAIASIANTQAGSASTDFMLNTLYSIKLNKLSINTGASYKLNTANSDQYHFGNKFSASSFVSYAIEKTKISFIPNAGLLYENTAANKLDKQAVEQTGGNLLAAAAGLEVSFKKITVGANVQVPASQHFASGQTELKTKGMLHISFSF
ncbi:transporter family protein [Ferruginibacter sp.]